MGSPSTGRLPAVDIAFGAGYLVLGLWMRRNLGSSEHGALADSRIIRGSPRTIVLEAPHNTREPRLQKSVN